MVLVVGLEYANAIDPAEAAEEAAPRADDDGPCFEAAIGEVGGVWWSGGWSFSGESLFLLLNSGGEVLVG